MNNDFERFIELYIIKSNSFIRNLFHNSRRLFDKQYEINKYITFYLLFDIKPVLN